MSIDVTRVMALVAERDALLEEAGKAIKTANKLTAEIKALCPHAMTVQKHSSSTDDWAQTTYYSDWDECVTCGAQLNTKHSSNTYRGI